MQEVRRVKKGRNSLVLVVDMEVAAPARLIPVRPELSLHPLAVFDEVRTVLSDVVGVRSVYRQEEELREETEDGGVCAYWLVTTDEWLLDEVGGESVEVL